ncbi:MAG: threonine synthase [Myxococcales bacterium]|nr:threonine synthase [Myxococcales bacterium]
MQQSTSYLAEFRCIAGCPERLPLTMQVYRCPKCGDLLEVVHDMEALKGRDAGAWKTLFAERTAQLAYPNNSGVWRKREWIAPHVRDEHIISLSEGLTPLQHVPRYGKQIGLENLWIKQCGLSHTGSFKDLGMTVLVSTVSQLAADGAKIPAIACASTGDTSAALSAYAAAAGLHAVVILPKGKITTAQLVQPLANGALVLAVDTDFDGCMELVAELAERDGVYLANSMNSLRLEGQKTVAIEIVEQLGWQVPDWIVIPGGNLGNVSALAAGFKMLTELGLIDKVPRVCVAQSANANPLYQSFQKGFESFDAIVAEDTAASAIRIGNPVSRDKAIAALRRHNGVVEQASEQELADASARADRAGLFTCPHTGVALAAAEKLIRRGQIAREEQVVVISTANGLKFSEFKTQYHESTLAQVAGPSLANVPTELPREYRKVREAVIRFLEPGD